MLISCVTLTHHVRSPSDPSEKREKRQSLEMNPGLYNLLRLLRYIQKLVTSLP